jgi:hypothetical protein
MTSGPRRNAAARPHGRHVPQGDPARDLSGPGHLATLRPLGKEGGAVRDSERRLAAVAAHDDVLVVDVARRAPEHDGLRLVGRQPLDAPFRHAPAEPVIVRAVPRDATAELHAGRGHEVDAEALEDPRDIGGDVRRSKDVAAQIQYDLIGPFRRLEALDPGDPFPGDLHLLAVLYSLVVRTVVEGAHGSPPRARTGDSTVKPVNGTEQKPAAQAAAEPVAVPKRVDG